MIYLNQELSSIIPSPAILLLACKEWRDIGNNQTFSDLDLYPNLLFQDNEIKWNSEWISLHFYKIVDSVKTK